MTATTLPRADACISSTAWPPRRQPAPIPFPPPPPVPASRTPLEVMRDDMLEDRRQIAGRIADARIEGQRTGYRIGYAAGVRDGAVYGLLGGIGTMVIVVGVLLHLGVLP